MVAREVRAGLRRKNQITLPESIVKQLDAAPGDQIIFVVDDNHPETVLVRRLRRSYAGVAAGIYGTADEEIEYVRRERAAWNE